MASVYDPEAFAQRVNYAAQCFMAGGRDTRHFDTCFEMWDGALVVTALVRRSLKNPRLRAAIAAQWRGGFPAEWEATAAKWAHIPTSKLADAAREVRAQRERESAAFFARVEKERAAKAAATAADPQPAVEATAAGLQYVIPGAEQRQAPSATQLKLLF